MVFKKMHMDAQQLQEHIVSERAARLKAYNDAYPDVGMGPSLEVFRSQAIKQLIEEKVLPENWEPSPDGNLKKFKA